MNGQKLLDQAQSIGESMLRTEKKLNDTTASILMEAEGLVHGDRQASYGHPGDDYKCVVDMFNAYMRHKYPQWKNILPEDGVMFMVFVKLSREANKSKRDNRVDAAGYLECLEMVLTR